MLISPTSTKKIENGIYAVITGISNFYIIKADEKLIAFDTGMNAVMSRAGFKKLGLDPNDVSHVFLTHSDYDHTGGLSLFKNAKVYLSKKEVPMINGQQPRLLILRNSKISGYITLEDRQTITAGNREIQIISTPGHTVGSACYMIDGTVLVSGDTLRTSKNGNITPFLFIQNMNHAGDKLSLAMLKDEGFLYRTKLILTGHTGILSK